LSNKGRSPLLITVDCPIFPSILIAKYLFIRRYISHPQYKEDSDVNRGPSWSGFYASWIFIYLCNQCLSPLMLWVRIPHRFYFCSLLCLLYFFFSSFGFDFIDLCSRSFVVILFTSVLGVRVMVFNVTFNNMFKLYLFLNLFLNVIKSNKRLTYISHPQYKEDSDVNRGPSWSGF
jgi:hypothetical protein